MKDYYSELLTEIEFSEQFDNLEFKSELGENISVCYNVRLAESLSREMAKLLGYNEEIAAVLALCKGIVFPPYGKAGMRYIESKMKREGIYLSPEKICLKYLEDLLKSSSLKITEELRDGVIEVFSEESNESEARIVKVIYDILRDIEALQNSGDYITDETDEQTPEDMTKDILYDAISESKAKGRISYSKKLKNMILAVNIKDEEQEELEECAKAVIDDLWNEYRKKGFSGDDIAMNVIFERERQI